MGGSTKLSGSGHCCYLSRSWEPGHPFRKQLARSWKQVNPKLRQVLLELAQERVTWPLYLYGPVGVGKTYAALALCDLVRFPGYWTVREVMDLMADREAKPPWELGKFSLAVLDELGTHKETRDFEYDAVKLFVDWRERLPAIFISNHPAEMMVSLYDRRIESRVSCGTVFELKGRDRRKPKEK